MKFIKIICLLSVLWASMAGCNKDDETVVPVNNIDTLISGNASLSIFKAVLAKADLRTFTRGAGPYTFFVPNNDAFKAAGINSEADVNLISQATATVLVTYHFLASNQTAIDIPVGPNSTATTQGGYVIYASKYSGNTYINGSKVLTADIAASNGTIHIMDKVFTPPVNNTLNTLAAFPNFKLLVQAINKAGIATTVNTVGSTVLAPDNTAFIAAGLDSTAIANSTVTTLSNILRYHIIAARLFSPDFKTGSYKTVQATNVAVDVTSGIKVKGTTNPTSFTVTGTDLLTSTGIVHSINGVLKP